MAEETEEIVLVDDWGDYDSSLYSLLRRPLALRTSYTRLDTYKSCPRRYKYTYLDREVAPASEAMLVGKAVHSALETWMAVGGEDVGDLLDFFTASVESMKDEGPISTEEEEAARAMLFDYFAQLASVDKSLILGVEKQFEIVIGGARIVGIIDRIGYVDNNKDNIVLTDYKSGRSSVSQAKAKDNMQMAVYTIAAKALWPGAAHYTTELNYPRLHKSVIHEFTLEELLKHKREINELALAIKLDSRFAPKGSPPKCGYCGHNRYCGTGKFNARIWNAIQAKRTRNGN